MKKGKRKVNYSFGERGSYVKLKAIIISFILLTFSLFMGNQVKAQDIIVLMTGEEIKSTVNEITPELIKYKKFENLSGPVYSVEKSKVFMIKYQNGTKDVFNQPETKPQNNQQSVQKPASQQAVSSSSQALTSRAGVVRLNRKVLPAGEVRKLYEPYPDALRSYNSGKTLCTVGDIVGYVGIGAGLIVGLSSTRYEYGSPQARSLSMTALEILLPTLVADIIIVSIGRGKIKSSVRTYNSAIIKPVTYKLDFGLQSGGIGFALKF